MLTLRSLTCVIVVVLLTDSGSGDNVTSLLDEVNDIDVIQIGSKNADIVAGHSLTFSLQVTGYMSASTSFNITFEPQYPELVTVSPPVVTISGRTTNGSHINETVTYCVSTQEPGKSTINISVLPHEIFDSSHLFLIVTAGKVEAIPEISSIIGWIYFAAWSVSFYPQIYLNFVRKSVVGLNFDYISLNIVGFFLYSLYNVGLYEIPAIQHEYEERFPRSLIPVQFHDMVFSVHACAATLITIVQCVIYERDRQRVSLVARILLLIFSALVAVNAVLAATRVIWWLDFLTYCSYIKLAITLIKYIPQAYMNYQRKSTMGWSIGNILLDFTGGILSMLEMLLNAYNYDDWISIFSDPTKFGLGFFSVAFDIFFMIQHYVLYRVRYEEIPGDNGRVTSADDIIDTFPT